MSAITRPIGNVYGGAWFVFIMWAIIAALGLLNLMTAIFVESIIQISRSGPPAQYLSLSHTAPCSNSLSVTHAVFLSHTQQHAVISSLSTRDDLSQVLRICLCASIYNLVLHSIAYRFVGCQQLIRKKSCSKRDSGKHSSKLLSQEARVRLVWVLQAGSPRCHPRTISKV